MQNRILNLKLLLLLTIFFPINLISMEEPEGNDYVISAGGESDDEFEMATSNIQNINNNYSYFENLDPELKAYILRLGVISIIKRNAIFSPFAGVVNFLKIFRQINHECKDVVAGVLPNIEEISFEDIKSIAKEHFVKDEFKYLTRKELNEKLVQILNMIDALDYLLEYHFKELCEKLKLLSIEYPGFEVNLRKRAAELIIAGASVNLQIAFQSYSSYPLPILDFCVMARCSNLANLLISYELMLICLIRIIYHL